MNKSLSAAILMTLMLASCGPLNRNGQNGGSLPEKVKAVMAGTDTTSGLAVLRDKDIPAAPAVNSIKQDSFSFAGKRYYTVLAEYPDPVYNRFAILDTNNNLLLVDKSLNGHLSQSKISADHIKFIQVKENFISNEVYRLKRVSFYAVNDKGEAELVFRTYTELSEPEITYKQDITRIRINEIDTKIYSTDPGKSLLKSDGDVFYFDNESGKYISSSDIFNDFVLNEVNNLESATDKPQITSRESYLRQRGIITAGKTEPHKLGKFSMPLSDEWHEVKNVTIAGLLKHPEKGTKFINDHYGAEISVIQLPPDDSAERYIKYPLENISSGNYKVRFSEKVSGGKYFYQFFEYSCGKEKFLLILQTLKTTYDEYKDDYQNLINSFSMDC